MGDIDFDELDKAVSSLMNKTDAESSARATQPVPDNSSTDQQQTQPKVNDISSSSRSTVEDMTVPERSAPESAPIVGRRSSGRFMDVIPAGGASRAVVSRPTPSAMASREGTNLQPVAQAYVPNEPSEPQQNEMADGDELLSFQPEVAGAQDAPSPDMGEFGPAPLTSPFLEGVEIDKRPLGGSTAATSSVSEEWSDSQVESPAMPDPIDFSEEPLPSIEAAVSDPWGDEAQTDAPAAEDTLQPELSPEVLAVETMPLDTPASKEQPVNTQSFTNTPEKVTSANSRSITENVAPSAASITPGDIKPQYAPVPADAPQPSAVFEAASESPQSLNHPEKKKSGWSVVLWILLMVIIGIAGGVAVWYFLVR